MLPVLAAVSMECGAYYYLRTEEGIIILLV
jgi:hypothetical protein